MFLILLFLQLGWSTAPDASEVVQPESQIQVEQNNQCFKPNSVAAINKDMLLKGKTYPAGTEIYFDDMGRPFYFPQDENADPIPLSDGSNDISCDQLTPIATNPLTGELREYNIPYDYKIVGPGKKPKKRKSGTTYCYRAVKLAVRNQVTLTGAAAYMAAPQLAAAGYTKVSYNDARNGAICVFGAGGIKTPSGGHKYGHIGIKGRSGLIDPNSGFRLRRPFIGCYQKQA